MIVQSRNGKCKFVFLLSHQRSATFDTRHKLLTSLIMIINKVTYRVAKDDITIILHQEVYIATENISL